MQLFASIAIFDLYWAVSLGSFDMTDEIYELWIVFKCLIRRKQIEQQEMVPKTDSLGIVTNILFQRINVDTFLLRKSVNLQKISTEHTPII